MFFAHAALETHGENELSPPVGCFFREGNEIECSKGAGRETEDCGDDAAEHGSADEAKASHEFSRGGVVVR